MSILPIPAHQIYNLLMISRYLLSLPRANFKLISSAEVRGNDPAVPNRHTPTFKLKMVALIVTFLAPDRH
jgi:hypothetical protein